GDATRYVGDVLAGVVAESEAIARQALELIRVEYDVLEPIVDMHEALKADSPTVHPPEVWPGNVLSQTVVNRGDFAAAYAQTTHLSRGVYQTQTIEHGFMEPECAIGLPDEDGVFVYSQSQGVFEDQIQIAKLLGVDKEKIKVELVPNGGGFG